MKYDPFLLTNIPFTGCVCFLVQDYYFVLKSKLRAKLARSYKEQKNGRNNISTKIHYVIFVKIF